MKPHPLAEALAVAEAFPDLPLEAVIKEDVLRRGVWITEEALALPSNPAYAPKSYFIFSFDREPLDRDLRRVPAGSRGDRALGGPSASGA